MATSLAETYYLKAIESYPWELAEVVENLNYALSYDSECAAAHCLMGQVKFYYLKRWAEAESHYEQAITADPEYTCAYEHLILLYIKRSEITKAHTVLHYAQSLKGMSRCFVMHAMALILEHKGHLKLAKRYQQAAVAEALSKDEQDSAQEELERLKDRIKARKKLK